MARERERGGGKVDESLLSEWRCPSTLSLPWTQNISASLKTQPTKQEIKKLTLEKLTPGSLTFRGSPAKRLNVISPHHSVVTSIKNSARKKLYRKFLKLNIATAL